MAGVQNHKHQGFNDPSSCCHLEAHFQKIVEQTEEVIAAL